MTVERFAFGRNWQEFANSLTETQITNATESLESVLGDLDGKTFLDVGCGSGIHSLAALRLGAVRVHAFDYDEASVECAKALRERFAPTSPWQIERGSALDEDYLRSLGKFDVVYAWGVLHHTGDMWKALELVLIPVRSELMLSVYNDQGWQSRFWKALKHRYVLSGRLVKRALELFAFTLLWGGSLAYNTFRLRPWTTISKWRNYGHERGMSPWTDVVDWAGGYPFEVAKPGSIVEFYSSRGLELEKSKLYGNRLGPNEFTFRRSSTMSLQRPAAEARS